MQSLTFEFEELALIAIDGFEAGLMNGAAEIEYWPDGSWSVAQVSLDGYRAWTAEQREEIRTRTGSSPLFESKRVPLHKNSTLTVLIISCIVRPGKVYDEVQEAVREALHDERDSRADTQADRRRDLARV